MLVAPAVLSPAVPKPRPSASSGRSGRRAVVPSGSAGPRRVGLRGVAGRSAQPQRHARRQRAAFRWKGQHGRWAERLRTRTTLGKCLRRNGSNADSRANQGRSLGAGGTARRRRPPAKDRTEVRAPLRMQRLRVDLVHRDRLERRRVDTTLAENRLHPLRRAADPAPGLVGVLRVPELRRHLLATLASGRALPVPSSGKMSGSL